MRFIRILFVGILAVSPSGTGAAPQDSDDKAVALAPVDVTLTVDIAGTGSGTVTSSPSGLATCTGAARTCVGGFETGTVVTLTAAAATGHEFTGWGGACQGTDTCTVMMADARYVAAHFRLIPAVGTSFYHLDTLGSVRAVTNAVGDVIRRDDYHAFGEAGTPPVGDPIRFTGKERDAETALDYFGARYYRNLAGRFTTVDPVIDFKQAPQNPQRWNRYSYALNDPLKFVDPDGRNPWAIGGAIGAAVFGGWKIVQNVAQGETWYDGVAAEAGKGLIAGATLGLAAPALAGIGAAEIGGAATGAATGAGQLTSRRNLTEAFHHTLESKVDSILNGGLNRGASGAFATPTPGLTPIQAHLELALNPAGGVRNVVIRIDLAGLRKAGYAIPEITRVPGQFGMPGGGYQMRFDYDIPKRFLTEIVK